MPEVPRLSASIAHKLTTESALSGWAAHRLLGNMKPESSKSQIDGRMWHAAVLEDGHDIEVIDVADFKTADARVLRDAATAAGKIPVARPVFDKLKPAAARIREEMERRDLILDGRIEQRFEWTEYTDDGQPVECSGYIDQTNGVEIKDIKSSKTPTSRDSAMNMICRSHSILQDAAYRSAVATTDGSEVEDLDFIYVFFQTREPHSITPLRMSGSFREISHLRWRRAIHLWHDCISKGTDRKYWPDVTEGIEVMDAPGWMLSQETELEAIRD